MSKREGTKRLAPPLILNSSTYQSKVACMNDIEIIKKYAAGIRDFVAINLSEANLSGVNLSGANLSEANLSVANLAGASLCGANLSRAKLNVARLSGANLSKANLTQANLNVANLIRADLRGANLTQAALIRAELIRAELSGATLQEANLSGADLREAALKQANLTGANLSEANLRGAFLTGANLQGANLNGTDLSRTDLSGANLREAELRQANLSCANLSGADLGGANLRWADLSEAKLSGANLTGADLSNAHLLNASFVHADLSKARLIQADWIGADLTGAILTGAKLYGVSRFGLKTQGVTLTWVDMSPDGDKSQILDLSTEDSQNFFNDTLPTVRLIIDAPLDLDANLALASTYHRIAQVYRPFNKAPSIDVGVRRTALTFRIDSNAELFTIAYLAILPFSDADATHQNIIAFVNMIQSQAIETLPSQEQKQIRQLIATLNRTIAQIDAVDRSTLTSDLLTPLNFTAAPTQTVVTNSSAQSLSIYYHPAFGKHLMNQSRLLGRSKNVSVQTAASTLPPVDTVIEFIKAFD